MIDDFVTISAEDMVKLLIEGKAKYMCILPDDKAYIIYEGKDYVFDKITNEYVSGDVLLRFYER